jgi:hypothetical protein
MFDKTQLILGYGLNGREIGVRYTAATIFFFNSALRQVLDLCSPLYSTH